MNPPTCVREALAAFDEQGMVDPLGFGVVRDAFSEMLFPGISTVQTRARYFLFVPWIYRSLDMEGVSPGEGLKVARERETALIESLLRGSSEQEGIIGRFSRAGTKQLPSFTYWGGLGRWQIRLLDVTRQEYAATLASRRQSPRRDSEMAPASQPWHPCLPSPPDGLFDEADLLVTEAEAEFLRGRILSSAPDTYLALLVRDGHSGDAATSPWEHPVAPSVPALIATQLKHARLFATVAWGAGLLYNDELSRLLEGDGGEGLSVDYGTELVQWVALVASEADALAKWDRQEFWRIVRSQTPTVPARVLGFVDWWLDEAIADPSRAVAGSESRRRLRVREAELKGARAKLANRRSRERSPTAQGGDLMTFRWPQASRITADIHLGLEDHAKSA